GSAVRAGSCGAGCCWTTGPCGHNRGHNRPRVPRQSTRPRSAASGRSACQRWSWSGNGTWGTRSGSPRSSSTVFPAPPRWSWQEQESSPTLMIRSSCTTRCCVSLLPSSIHRSLPPGAPVEPGGTWRREAEQGLAVAAAEQEDEPLQVAAQFVQAVGGVADELCQGGGQAGGVAGQPLAEELQH